MNGRKNKFDRRMESFKEIRYTANKFLRPVYIVVRADGDEVKLFSRGVSGELRPFFDYGPKSEFLKAFGQLSVGKWKKRYTSRAGLFGERRWELLITFSDGGDLRYSGNDAYPANFGALDRLLRTDYAV